MAQMASTYGAIAVLHPEKEGFLSRWACVRHRIWCARFAFFHPEGIVMSVQQGRRSTLLSPTFMSSAVLAMPVCELDLLLTRSRASPTFIETAQVFGPNGSTSIMPLEP